VQERVVDLESSSKEAREDTDDESLVLGAEGSDDEDVGDDGCWWWPAVDGGTEAKAARWVVPQWEVLAVDRVEWRRGLERLGVNEREVGVC
jgi:hypothetical protein